MLVRAFIVEDKSLNFVAPMRFGFCPRNIGRLPNTLAGSMETRSSVNGAYQNESEIWRLNTDRPFNVVS